jgi:Arc/MetJ-type ribon-helix-helix transcriptional regulator
MAGINVTVRMEKALHDKLKQMIKTRGFSSVPELLRQLSREWVEDELPFGLNKIETEDYTPQVNMPESTNDSD